MIGNINTDRFRTRPNRRSIRLKGYDYAQVGAYFVTVCTQGRACLFGDVVDGQMRLNEAGQIVQRCWLAIPDHFPHAELDAWVVMPNHVHGIIVIVGATHASPLPNAPPLHASSLDASPLPHTSPLHASPQPQRPRGPGQQSIGAIVGSFKSAVSKQINEFRGTPGLSVWQRNYYEHIIRNEDSLDRIRQYILDNPSRWAFDRENPNASEYEPEDAWRT